METVKVRLKEIDDLACELGYTENFIGTGFACNFYADTAKALHVAEYITAEEAVDWYDHKAGGAHWWPR